MKYRLLSQEELNELRQEFIKFLIINGIDAAEWENLKKENPSTVKGIIEQFSESVFEGICRKISFLRHENDELQIAVQFLAKKMNVIRKSTSDQQASLEEKAYKHSREEDIFFLLNSGYRKEEAEDVFKKLCLEL
jgi:hypothetical protein